VIWTVRIRGVKPSKWGDWPPPLAPVLASADILWTKELNQFNSIQVYFTITFWNLRR